MQKMSWSEIAPFKGELPTELDELAKLHLTDAAIFQEYLDEMNRLNDQIELDLVTCALDGPFTVFEVQQHKRAKLLEHLIRKQYGVESDASPG